MASIPTPQEIAYQEAHITDDRSGSIIAANATCYAIGIIAVALRFLSRRISKIRYEWDDWLVVAGLVRPPLPSIYISSILLFKIRESSTDIGLIP